MKWASLDGLQGWLGQSPPHSKVCRGLFDYYVAGVQNAWGYILIKTKTLAGFYFPSLIFALSQIPVDTGSSALKSHDWWAE